jgi:hypothetical protein
MKLSVKNLERECMLHAVRAERETQDAKWGGPAHDEQHTPPCWIQLLRERLALANGTLILEGAGPAYRRRLMQVAAVAVAAIEASIRQGDE